MSGTSSNLIRDNIVKDAATGKTINLSFFSCNYSRSVLSWKPFKIDTKASLFSTVISNYF